MSVFLHSLELFTPDHSADQDTLAVKFGEMSGDPTTARIIRHVFRRSGIARRHSVIPDFTEPERAELFRPAVSGPVAEPSTGDRMRLYSRYAGPISVGLARRVLDSDAGFEPGDVTHVITVSCTGFENPGSDWRIITELGLNPGIERYHLGFMGCYAAFPALRMARQFCMARPDAVVLIVCLELCSLHMRRQSSADSILGNALFADGAAAALVSARRPSPGRPSVALKGFMSAIAPEGQQAMAWEIGDHGFDLRLSSYVPDLIGANIARIVDAQLEAQRLGRGDIDLWAVHPGGKSILDKVEDALGLRPEQLMQSRSVLRDFGNMSSATILFVLKRLIDSLENETKSVAAMAFGPGLTIECGLLELAPAERAQASHRAEPVAALA